MTNLTGDVKLSGAAIGDVTIATTNADGSMRSLSAILADCRGAFAGMTEPRRQIMRRLWLERMQCPGSLH